MVFGKKRAKLFHKNALLGQTTIETLIIFSVSLLIITVILGMAFNHLQTQRDFEQRKLGEFALNTLATEINDAYFLGPGTTKTIVLTLPELTNLRKSFIHKNDLVLNVAGTDLFKTTVVDVKGNWPTTTGEYSFRIVAFPDFVSINVDSIEFNPKKIQEKILQSSEKKINLTITNNSDSVKTFNLSVIPFSSNKATISIDNSYGNFSINPSESTTIPITLHCLYDSSGTYVGGINFVSDLTMTYPIVVTCESAQEKLSIYPGTRSVTNYAELKNKQIFSVCNNSANDLFVDTLIDGNLYLVSSTAKKVFVPKHSCTPLDLNLFSNNAGFFSGKLKIFSAGYNSFSNIDSNFLPLPIHYFFKSVLDNNLNNWFSFGNNTKQRENDFVWIATGELDWNKDKNFAVNGDGWDQNLIAYYNFNTKIQQDGNWVVLDLARGNDGNLMNEANIVEGGVWDSNAIEFDGVDDYFDLNYESLIVVPDGTFSGWVFRKDNSRSMIFSLTGTQNSFNEFSIDVDDSNRFGLSIKKDNSFSLSLDVNYPRIDSNKWYHFAVVCGNGGNKVFINGEKISSEHLIYSNGNSSTTSCFSTPNDINSARIGSRDTGVHTGPGTTYDTYFNGLIDEVSVWDRNLSDGEIFALYNSSVVAKFVDKNIVDAGVVVDWNSIQINSNFDYGFGDTVGVSSVDMNVYSCDDPFC